MFKVSFLSKKRVDAVHVVERGFLGSFKKPRFKVQIYIYPYNRQPLFSLLYLINPFQIIKLFFTYRTSDIVHYSSFDVYFIIFNLIFRRFSRAKTVLTVYHLEMDPTNRLLDKLGLYDKIFRSFDAIIAISGFSKRQLLGLGVDGKKITIAPLGVDNRLAYRLTAKKETSPYILFVGDEYPRKNFTTVLKAFKLLTTKFRSLKLVKIGVVKNAAHKSISDNLIKKLQLEEHVVLRREHVPESELNRYYSGAELLISASTMEGFGLPVIEAMRCKCIPVVSYVGPYKELELPENLYVKSLKNPRIWAGKIRQILDLKSGQKKSFKTLLYKKSLKYTWKNYATSVGRVYEKITA